MGLSLYVVLTIDFTRSLYTTGYSLGYLPVWERVNSLEPCAKQQQQELLKWLLRYGEDR